MKPASPELIALLATRQFHRCGLFEFVLSGGSSLFYASGDVNVSHDGDLYSAGGSIGPYFDRAGNRARCKWKAGIEVDTLKFDVMPGTGQVNGRPFLTAVRAGIFDGAELIFSNAYWPKQAFQTPVVPTGTIVKFVGRVAQIDTGRSLARFTVNGHTELFNQPVPRNVYQSGCVNTLYDASCSLIKASFGVNSAVEADTTAALIKASLAEATGYFDLGVITFTNGPNDGLSRTVKQYTQGSPGTIKLISPFPDAPEEGDTFTIYPGCDKTEFTCVKRFDNLENFRGFPFIPEATTAV